MDKRAKNDNILPLDKVSRGISKAFTLTELIVVVTILAIL
ncbi:MAG: prepilin-type N-terminal cleavage/methylation domain-containing protein [Candidatus Peribacteria bacterium]|jgi:prepilin-type N-terminal cleavage/methylation domain-containing protein|nr:prepilin-type N-terminal cleavage/methylation domain-containing protein [Candidatus Peribacteria bacterium]